MGISTNSLPTAVAAFFPAWYMLPSSSAARPMPALVARYAGGTYVLTAFHPVFAASSPVFNQAGASSNLFALI